MSVSTATIEKRLLSVPEAAAELGVSPDTVRSWVKSGALRSISTPGPKRPRFKIPRSALVEFELQAGQQRKPVKPQQRRRKQRRESAEFVEYF